MSYTIPQNWNDEAMEYVNRLTDKINVGWDGEDYCLSDWNLRFFSRMNRGAIKPSFKYEAFLDNEDIIATLEGYELDVEKFWFALLYIYDITTDFGINAADASKTDYDILIEIDDYLQKHPQPFFICRTIRSCARASVTRQTVLWYCWIFVVL